MTDEQPTDPRLPIMRRLAAALGLKLEDIAGTGDGHPPAIEVDLDPAGERHQLVWRGGASRTIAGMITVYSNDGAHGVRIEGADCSTWQPPITVGAPTIYEAVTDAAARLGELFDERLEAAKQDTSRILITPADDGDVNVTPVDAEGAPVGGTSTVTPARGSLIAELIAELTAKGWKESVAAAAVRTVTSPDPYADASDDEHCRHGYPYPDCAVCHRTAGGAPNREPGEHDPAGAGAALGLQATVERLKSENAEMKARLGIDPDGYSREPGELEQLRAEVAELRTAFESCKGRYRDYVDASRAHTKRQDAEIERLGTELAQANRELGEQRALADAMQAGIDQCSNTHDIDWPGDE